MKTQNGSPQCFQAPQCRDLESDSIDLFTVEQEEERNREGGDGDLAVQLHSQRILRQTRACLVHCCHLMDKSKCFFFVFFFSDHE